MLNILALSFLAPSAAICKVTDTGYAVKAVKGLTLTEFDLIQFSCFGYKQGRSLRRAFLNLEYTNNII